MADAGGYKIKEYAVADIVANYEITKNLSIYAKLENAFDAYYEKVREYGMPPLGAFAGVKAKF